MPPPDASWSPARTALEQRIEGVLSRLAEDPRAAGLHPALARTVVIGGGTGLSTILGGPDPDGFGTRGIMREFSRVQVGVCTTDDGGSTGQLVRRLPMIGIGDFRKVMLSMMDPARLARRYGPGIPAAVLLQRVFSHRFGDRPPTAAEWKDPLRVLPADAARSASPALRRALAALAGGPLPADVRRRLFVPGHCFGNLLMAAAVFRAAGFRTDRAPSAAALRRGLADVATVLCVAPGTVHPATAVPGMLVYEYANGVSLTGQALAAQERRGCAVRRVGIRFAARPAADPRLLAALREADLIVYAPGSLYSSILPVLLVPGVADAIRANRTAIKVLGANLWIQEGETDRSFREESRGFWVSELIEAYGRNIPGGTDGLFDAVLSASLDAVPASIIRNYALEDKHPIHLDRARVAALGVLPVEASLFHHLHWRRDVMLHHDAARFAAALRTLYEELSAAPRRHRPSRPAPPHQEVPRRGGSAAPPAPLASTAPTAAARMESCRAALSRIPVAPASLRPLLEDFLWKHADILPTHLARIRRIRVVPADRWTRSQEWDNIQGYYDPATSTINLHAQALATPQTLMANFAIALGESLLGNYIAEKRWLDDPAASCRVYEIRLRPPAARDCFLDDRSLSDCLRLAQMQPRAGDPLRWWRAVPRDSGFLPCGIFFGLAYAWYLDNRYTPSLDMEMEMLHWPPARLLPYQNRIRTRHRAAVRFFRNRIFTP